MTPAEQWRRDKDVLVKLHDHAQGKAWEPRQSKHPLLVRLVAAGMLRRVNGRCGFELIPDAMVTFTLAGLDIVAAHRKELQNAE
jgi:hypothetical protein